MAFIDADKAGYPAYYEAVVPLMRPGGLIVADNVLRGGRVLDGAARDADTSACAPSTTASSLTLGSKPSC